MATAAATKNLVVIVQPNTQFYDPADFVEITDRVRSIAPDINAIVVSATAKSHDIPEYNSPFPTLVVSFNQKPTVWPLRGRVLFNQQIDKLEQTAILSRAGISVPRCAKFEFGTRLDPELWGEFVLLKTAVLRLTSQGNDVSLFRRSRLSAMKSSDFPSNHPIHTMPMIVQRFIDTGRYPSKYRALTLFGQVLYAQHTVLSDPRPDLKAPDNMLSTALVATGGGERNYYHKHYPDVVALAGRVANEFPAIPLLGIDIVRDIHTSALHVLEINAGGNVWHFSSSMWATRRNLYPKVARRMKEQYGAFDTAARALVKATRRFAL